MPTLLQLNRKVDYIGTKFETLRELVCKLEPGGGSTFINSPAYTITEENIENWDNNSNSVNSWSANRTISTQDYTGLYNASSGNLSVNLPTINSSFENNKGRIFTIKKIDSSTNTVSVIANGSELIDGLNTQILYSQNDFITVQATSTGWVIVSKLIQIKNIVTNSNITLPSTNLYYTYTGAGGNVTLSPVTNNVTIRNVIMNGGTGDLIINSNSGSPDIMRDGMNESSITLMAGETANLINNSLKWVKI